MLLSGSTSILTDESSHHVLWDHWLWEHYLWCLSPDCQRRGLSRSDLHSHPAEEQLFHLLEYRPPHVPEHGWDSISSLSKLNPVSHDVVCLWTRTDRFVDLLKTAILLPWWKFAVVGLSLRFNGSGKSLKRAIQMYKDHWLDTFTALCMDLIIQSSDCVLDWQQTMNRNVLIEPWCNSKVVKGKFDAWKVTYSRGQTAEAWQEVDACGQCLSRLPSSRRLENHFTSLLFPIIIFSSSFSSTL